MADHREIKASKAFRVIVLELPRGLTARGDGAVNRVGRGVKVG